MNHRKISFSLIALVILMAFALMVSSAGAKEERTLEQRISALETQVAQLLACNPIACDAKPGTAPDLALPPGMVSPAPLGQDPTATLQPSDTPVPPSPTQTQKPKCNQGVGNGPEGCDPGNSNNHNPSNDENPNNRGGKQVP